MKTILCSRHNQKEAFDTNIHDLIVKWEEIGGEGGSVEGGEGGSIVSRRKSSEFQRKLAVFEQSQKTDNPDAVTF